MASANETAVPLPWTSERERRPAGFQVVLPKRTHVLAWSRFISAEGDSSEVSAIFYNCAVVIRGCGLDALLSDLAAQCITLLEFQSRPDRFQQAAQQVPVRIEEIHLREVER